MVIKSSLQRKVNFLHYQKCAQHKSVNYLQVTYCPSSLQIARHLSPTFQSLLVHCSSSCGCSAAKSFAVTSSSTLELPAPPSADFKSRSCVLIRSRVSSITSSRSTFNFRSSSFVGSVVRAASTYKTHFKITYNETVLVLRDFKTLHTKQIPYTTPCKWLGTAHKHQVVWVLFTCCNCSL